VAGAIHEATTIENEGGEGEEEKESPVVHHRDCAPGGSLQSPWKSGILYCRFNKTKHQAHVCRCCLLIFSTCTDSAACMIKLQR